MNLYVPLKKHNVNVCSSIHDQLIIINCIYHRSTHALEPFRKKDCMRPRCNEKGFKSASEQQAQPFEQTFPKNEAEAFIPSPQNGSIER